MRKSISNRFLTARSEGGLLPPDLLARIAAGDTDLGGLKPEDYGLSKGDRINEATSRAWARCKSYWAALRAAMESLPETESGVTETREQWLQPLFRELGYGRLVYQQQPEPVGDRSYLLSHRAGEAADAPRIHTLGFRQELDRGQGAAEGAGARRASPHSLVQEYLNRTDHLWSIVSNGRSLRLLRDNASLTRPAYLEFDLEAMMEGGVYADFALMYVLLHRSRLPKGTADAPSCWLEKWREAAQRAGTRARGDLRTGVETAIRALGRGFLAHPANDPLRARLRSGELSVEDYYRQLLRLVYRFLFLLVAEERELLFPETTRVDAELIYARYYSVSRLRDLAEQWRRDDHHDDLWRGLRITFGVLTEGSPALGLEALNGGLFDTESCRYIDGSLLHNADLLAAIRGLSQVRAAKTIRRVNYRDMDVEELGSVYESLLDYHPILDTASAQPTFDLGLGSERKTTGSYYTPPELVQELIKSALEPVIQRALEGAASRPGSRPAEPPIEMRVCTNETLLRGLGRPEPAQAGFASTEPHFNGAATGAALHALLSLKICDPACGSGHFLLAAARRIGKEVARLRTGEAEPDPAHVRAGIREAIRHCIYGVDLNPLAIDLCKLALWLEGHTPGKPLSFLDHRIQCGNSLVGVPLPRQVDAAMKSLEAREDELRQPEMRRSMPEREWKAEIAKTKPVGWPTSWPDEAFKDVTGDDKKEAAAVRKRNKEERAGQFSLALSVDRLMPRASAGDEAAHEAMEIADLPDDRAEDVHAKEARYRRFRDQVLAEKVLAADAWTAAFFWPLRADAPALPSQDQLAGLHRGENRLTPEQRALVAELATENRFFHWHLLFSDAFQSKGGFDCVLGNPPWERIKLQEQEFFAAREPEIARAPNKAARQKLVDALEAKAPLLARAFERAQHAAEAQSKFVRDCSRFPLTAVGDVNTYALFAEQFRSLLGPNSRAGLICPTGIATDDTTKAFFADLIRSHSLASLIGFENEAFIFPSVHHSFKFCALTATGERSAVQRTDLAFLCRRFADVDDPTRRFQLSPDEIALLNPNTHTCPVFRTRADADLTKSIYRRVPVLVDEAAGEDPWGVSFLRMLDMANDSGLFRTEPGPGLMPLYEGKMLWHFDHRYSTYEGATQANLNAGILPQGTPDQKANPQYSAQPRYWVDSELVEERLQDNWSRDWLIAFRDVTSSVVERTAIFSLLPRVGVGHKAPLMLPGVSDTSLVACLLANTNSLVLDYVTRQKIGGTSLSYFILKQLPVLPPASYSRADAEFVAPRVLELVYTAWDMQPFARDMGSDGPPFIWDEERRAHLRAQLDAFYFHKYGLTEEETAYVLDPKAVYGEDFPGETFRVLKENEIRKYGEYRTQRLVLFYYRAWKEGNMHEFDRWIRPEQMNPARASGREHGKTEARI